MRGNRCRESEDFKLFLEQVYPERKTYLRYTSSNQENQAREFELAKKKKVGDVLLQRDLFRFFCKKEDYSECDTTDSKAAS